MSQPIAAKDTVGFLYPGQGAQRIGMGVELEKVYPLASRCFDKAEAQLGFSIRELCAGGPESLLNQDVNAQLAIYTVSCIITDILRQENIVPKYCTGYSSGFYAAAYSAGCFDFTDGLAVVKEAGEILLEEAMTLDGGMAVIFGLPLDVVEDIARKETNVEIAILNTPRQIVISGLNAHIGNVMHKAIKKGALDAYALPVGTAYHSRFMAAAGKRFLKWLQKKSFNAPSIPLFSYATLKPVTDVESLFETMSGQLSLPVLWVDLIKKLSHKNTNPMVEVGSGTMISRTVRWIDRTISIMNTASLNNVRRTIQLLAHYK